MCLIYTSSYDLLALTHLGFSQHAESLESNIIILAFQSCAKGRLLRRNTAQGSTQLSPCFMALGHLLMIKFRRRDNSANRIKGVLKVSPVCFDYLFVRGWS